MDKDTKSAVKRYLAAMIFLGLAVFASAQTYSHAQAHSLNVGYDTHKITLWNAAGGSGTNVGSKVLSGTQIAAYYDSGCNCYRVPLSIFTYVNGYTSADAVSARQQHLSPNLPSGQELTIEILD